MQWSEDEPHGNTRPSRFAALRKRLEAIRQQNQLLRKPRNPHRLSHVMRDELRGGVSMLPYDFLIGSGSFSLLTFLSSFLHKSIK